MKKIMFLFLLLGIFSCKENPQEPKVEVTWTVQVDYLDGVRDTLDITTDDITDVPYLSAGRDVASLGLGYHTKAAYVKSFKVLNKTIK